MGKYLSFKLDRTMLRLHLIPSSCHRWRCAFFPQPRKKINEVTIQVINLHVEINNDL